MRCGYPSAKRPRMPDRTSLRAPRANESFVHLFKGGGVQGQSPCPRSAERGTLMCLMKRRRGSKGEPSPGVPPFIFSLSTCAPIRWEVVVALSCDSTPFLWCLPKETVSSRQRKALFYLGVSTIRVSATSRWTIRSSPDLGLGADGIFWCARTSVKKKGNPFYGFPMKSLKIRRDC